MIHSVWCLVIRPHTCYSLIMSSSTSSSRTVPATPLFDERPDPDDSYSPEKPVGHVPTPDDVGSSHRRRRLSHLSGTAAPGSSVAAYYGDGPGDEPRGQDSELLPVPLLYFRLRASGVETFTVLWPGACYLPSRSLARGTSVSRIFSDRKWYRK